MVVVRDDALPQLASRICCVGASLVASLRRNYKEQLQEREMPSGVVSVQTKRIGKSPKEFRSRCGLVRVHVGVAPGDSRRTECVSA
jgi:hypothetical protein